MASSASPFPANASQESKASVRSSQGNIAQQPGDSSKPEPTETKTPEPQPDDQSPESDVPSTPGQLAPFDWQDFEARYEKALRDADACERATLKEAQQLSQYFRAWASAASAHDDERVVKRLRTRQRFVNLAEEGAAQKQQHYIAHEMEAAPEAREQLPYDDPQAVYAQLDAFYQSHFSDEAVEAFHSTFLDPTSAFADFFEQAENDLGFYEDGVKRTLTDEQIEMFRQSEIRELRRKRDQAAHSVDTKNEADAETGNHSALGEASHAPEWNRPSKKKRKKGANKVRHEPKPDLRKRTWDVVEAGLDTLDYD